MGIVIKGIGMIIHGKYFKELFPGPYIKFKDCNYFIKEEDIASYYNGCGIIQYFVILDDAKITTPM